MEKSGLNYLGNSSFLGRKRLHLSSFNNSLFRPLISTELKNEYEHISWLYKNIFSFDWNEKFIRENQQVLDNMSPNSIWFLFCCLYYPNDFNEIISNDDTFVSDLFSTLIESEPQSIKKAAPLKNKLQIFDDIKSLSSSTYLSSVESKISSLLNQVHEVNNSKITKLSAKCKQIKNFKGVIQGPIKPRELIKDITVSKESCAVLNKFSDFLFNENKKRNLANISEGKIFDSQSEIKKIKDDDEFICFICNNGDLDDNQLIYECESCLITVHQSCYGIKTEKVQQWKCDACKKMSKEEAQNLECVLCPVRGGAMKEAELPVDSSFSEKLKEIRQTGNTNCKYNSYVVVPVNDYKSIKCSWVHLSCALWNQNIQIDNFEEKTGIKYIDAIDFEDFNNYCNICNKRGYGPTLKCKHISCNFHCHPECARINKYHLEVVNVKGTLNYNIYCFEHQPITLVQNFERKSDEKEEDVKFYANFLKKKYKAYEKEYKKSLTEIRPFLRGNWNE